MEDELGDHVKTYTSEEVSERLGTCNVRRALASLRQRWSAHGPAHPMCLSELIDADLTVSEFCVLFLLAQRSKRNGTSSVKSGDR